MQFLPIRYAAFAAIALTASGCSESSDDTTPTPTTSTSTTSGTTSSTTTTTDPGTCGFTDPVCEAATGYRCWYVAPEGSDEGDGSFETPFRTLQHAVEAMGGGDTVYLRAGTYAENVQIPDDKNGTCIDRDCSEGSWSTIKSYPCEWAVLDGGHRDTHVLGRWHSGSGSGTMPSGSYDVLPDGTWGELPDGAFGGLADIHFWKVEHLEITGGCQETGGAGWAASGGPFWIRYVYFHDNSAESRDANPGAIRGYTWHDSVVERCVFIDNGCNIDDGNCADINIFSDYADSRQGWNRELWEANGPHTITYATRNNEYRYNYFEGTPVGIKHKNDQVLAARIGDDKRYAELGDRIHHNIFRNNSHAGILTSQDFAQTHHNILVDSFLSNNQYHGLDMIELTTYNNLVVRKKIHYHVPYYGDYESDWSEIVIDFRPEYACMNNIVEGFENEWDSAAISLGVGMDKDDSGVATVELTDAIVDRNYVYRPLSTDHYRIGRNAGACSDFLTTSAMNTCYATTNYTNDAVAADPLHPGDSGADALKTLPGHAVATAQTLGAAGIDSAHPFLAGVSIPSYVGPCPDEACAWVDEVLGLVDGGPMRQMQPE